jgi:hypothetical protein
MGAMKLWILTDEKLFENVVLIVSVGILLKFVRVRTPNVPCILSDLASESKTRKQGKRRLGIIVFGALGGSNPMLPNALQKIARYLLFGNEVWIDLLKSIWHWKNFI